jgi:hypothetical protein
MLIVPIPMRRLPRDPNHIGALAAAGATLGGGYFVLYAIGRTGGRLGLVAAAALALVALGVLYARHRARAAAARAAAYAPFHPRVRYGVSTQVGPLHEVVAPYLSAGLPGLRPLRSAVDPGVWADPATGHAMVRVPLRGGLRLEHLSAAAPPLAHSWGLPAVRVHRQPGTRTAAVLELCAALSRVT